MKNLLTVALALLLSIFSSAQSAEKDVAIGIHFGTKEYAGELGNEFFSFGQHFAFGVSISQYISPSFDVMGLVSYGQIDHADSLTSFKNNLVNLNLLAKYKFANGKILKSDAKVAPFLFLGIGDAIETAGHYVDNLNTSFNFPMGAGVDFRLNDKFALSVMTSYNYMINDRVDNADYGGQLNWHDQYLFTSLGLKFSFPRADKDRDGVRNKFDNCPDVAGTISNKGCPEIPETDRDVMRRAMEGLFFETGSSNIKSESLPILQNVANLLKVHPEYNLSINGHTDNTGGDDLNLKLSQDRADAAKQYLVNQGISADRISATGYGSSKPIQSNDTEEGRSKNRRVEFKLKF